MHLFLVLSSVTCVSTLSVFVVLGSPFDACEVSGGGEAAFGAFPLESLDETGGFDEVEMEEPFVFCCCAVGSFCAGLRADVDADAEEGPACNDGDGEGFEEAPGPGPSRECQQNSSSRAQRRCLAMRVAPNSLCGTDPSLLSAFDRPEPTSSFHCDGYAGKGGGDVQRLCSLTLAITCRAETDPAKDPCITAAATTRHRLCEFRVKLQDTPFMLTFLTSSLASEAI